MTPDQITPNEDRILLEVLPDEQQAYEGLISVDHAASPEKSNLAVILALGYAYKGQLSVGTKVIFNKYAGTILTFDRFDKNTKEYRVVKNEDIHAFLTT